MVIDWAGRAQALSVSDMPISPPAGMAAKTVLNCVGRLLKFRAKACDPMLRAQTLGLLASQKIGDKGQLFSYVLWGKEGSVLELFGIGGEVTQLDKALVL